MDDEAKTTLSQKANGFRLRDPSAKLSPRFVDAFKSSLFQQSWGLVVTAFLLESRQSDLFVLVAIAGHWLLMLLISIRRPGNPTRGDLLLCEFGFVPVGLFTLALAPVVWFSDGGITLCEVWFGRVMIADSDSLLPLQVVAGMWIIFYFVLDISWIKVKLKGVKSARKSASEVDETISKVESLSDATNTLPDTQRVKANVRENKKGKTEN